MEYTQYDALKFLYTYKCIGNYKPDLLCVLKSTYEHYIFGYVFSIL